MERENKDVLEGRMTRAGLPALAALAGMERYILRKQEDLAIDLAYDLYRTSLFWTGRVWDSLMLLAARRYAGQTPDILDFVYSARRTSEISEPYTPESGGMMALCFIQVIRRLCELPEDGELEQEVDRVCAAYERGEDPPIPAFARDHHTAEGRAQGRNPLNFLDPEAGSKVIPEVEGLAEPDKDKLRALLSDSFGKGQPFCPAGYSCWAGMQSAHGRPIDLLQSSFQKTIRRGMTPQALAFAFELFCSGADVEAFVWDRMLILTAEDIGAGDWGSNRVLLAANATRGYFADDPKARFLLVAAGVRYLAGCPKERGTELRKGILVREFAAGKTPKL